MDIDWTRDDPWLCRTETLDDFYHLASRTPPPYADMPVSESFGITELWCDEETERPKIRPVALHQRRVMADPVVGSIVILDDDHAFDPSNSYRSRLLSMTSVDVPGPVRELQEELRDYLDQGGDAASNELYPAEMRAFAGVRWMLQSGSTRKTVFRCMCREAACASAEVCPHREAVEHTMVSIANIDQVIEGGDVRLPANAFQLLVPLASLRVIAQPVM